MSAESPCPLHDLGVHAMFHGHCTCPPRPERTPTDVLVERARARAEAFREAGWERLPDLLTALAGRLDELAALEPVRELLAAMRERPGADPRLTLDWLDNGDWIARLWLGQGPCLSGWGQTPEAALAALAEQVRG